LLRSLRAYRRQNNVEGPSLNAARLFQTAAIAQNGWSVVGIGVSRSMSGNGRRGRGM
jgi:hypothetical protein